MSIRSHTRIGPFIIDECLSQRGGMSTVYLAHKADDEDFEVALKVSNTANNRPEYADFIKDEAPILQNLRHLGIVRIYPFYVQEIVYMARAYGIDESPWYYVMEYIDGEQLQCRDIAKNFPLLWRIELFYQIMIIVNYMHSLDYAHCDLKPENILFRYAPEENRMPIPVLVDFGNATVTKGNVREFKAASPPYAPPELSFHIYKNKLRDKAIAYHQQNPGFLRIRPKKIDIWSLGTLLFELLTGRRMFTGRTYEEIVTATLQNEFQRMRDRCPEVPEKLDKLLIDHMLQRNPNERKPVHEIIEAIERYIDPIRPPRISNKKRRRSFFF